MSATGTSALPVRRFCANYSCFCMNVRFAAPPITKSRRSISLGRRASQDQVRPARRPFSTARISEPVRLFY